MPEQHKQAFGLWKSSHNVRRWWMAAENEVSWKVHPSQFWIRLLEALEKRRQGEAKVVAHCLQSHALCCQRAPGLWAEAHGGDERPLPPNSKIGLCIQGATYFLLNICFPFRVSSRGPCRSSQSLFAKQDSHREGGFHPGRPTAFSPRRSQLNRLEDLGTRNRKRSGGRVCVCV